MSALIWVQHCLTLMVFLKEFFKKVDFEKKSTEDKNHAKFLSRQRVNSFISLLVYLIGFILLLEFKSDFILFSKSFFEFQQRTLFFIILFHVNHFQIYLLKLLRIRPKNKMGQLIR